MKLCVKIMPDEILRALLRLVETNKGNQMSPAVSSGEERGLLSRTAAGNRAYQCQRYKTSSRKNNKQGGL